MAIKSLRLQDFQSHKDSTFEFSPNLSCVVGSSNQGKSSIVRAFSLILYNQFDSSWVRYGASFCTLTLMMDNGTVIIREKGPKVNKYLLQVLNAPQQEFSNFGLEVPEVIQQALNIRKIVIDKDDSLLLNLSSQLEPLFLFNRSGSQKAKVFGHLSGAHILDFALRNLNTEKKQVSTEKNLKSKEVEEMKVQHTHLSKIYEYAPAIMGLIGADARIEESKKRVGKLQGLCLKTSDWKRRYTLEMEKETLLAKAPAVELDSVSVSAQRLRVLSLLLTRKIELGKKENTLNASKNQLDLEFDTASKEYIDTLGENKVCPVCLGILSESKLDEIKISLGSR